MAGTRVLRNEAPFFVVTDGTFPSIEDVMRRLFEAVPAAVSVTLTTSAGHSTLTVRLDFSADVPERDNPVGTILADLEHVRIVMTERRFVSATGFDLVNGTVATTRRTG